MKLITQPSHEFVKIPISADMKVKANEHARHIENASKCRKHRFGNDGYSQNYIGHIGELAVQSYLDTHNIKYGTQNTLGYQENGCGDNYDLLIYGKFFDVKTNHKVAKYSNLEEDWIKNNLFLVPVNQMYRRDDLKNINYYIDVQLDKYLQYAYIRGFVSQSDILELYSIPTMINCLSQFEIPLGDLRPISDLISTNRR